MKRLIIGLCVVVVVLIIYSGFLNTEQDAPQSPPGPSSPVDLSLAPDFELQALDGSLVKLSDYRGQDVFINFWASWCGPCRREMPDIEAIHREYAANGLVVLTVNLGEKKDTVQHYMQANSFTFPVLLDTDRRVARQYRVSSIPVSVFIDKEGKIRHQRVGLLSKEQMLYYIDDL